MRTVLKRPLLSEKSMSKNDEGKYVFEERYKVGVTSVRTITIHPKAKMRMTRRGFIVGKTAQRKKAIITVRKGQSIDIIGDLPTAE